MYSADQPSISRALRSLRIDCCDYLEMRRQRTTRMVPSRRRSMRILDCLAAMALGTVPRIVRAAGSATRPAAAFTDVLAEAVMTQPPCLQSQLIGKMAGHQPILAGGCQGRQLAVHRSIA